MKTIDLTTVRVVENEIQTLLEPYLESQASIQAFVDANEAVISSLAFSFEDMAKTVESVQKALSPKIMQESFKHMQLISDLAEASLKIPNLSSILPREFGHLYVDVLEEKEVVAADVGSIALLPYQEKRSLAVMVADEIEGRGLSGTSSVKPEPLRLRGSAIRHLAVLPMKDKDQVVIVVNGDYSSPVTRNLNKSWSMFTRAVEGEEFSFKEHRGVWDYFNFNDRCPLYTRTEHSLTKVFGERLGKTVFRVDVEIITQHKFTRRCNEAT